MKLVSDAPSHMPTETVEVLEFTTPPRYPVNNIYMGGTSVFKDVVICRQHVSCLNFNATDSSGILSHPSLVVICICDMV